MKSTSFGWLGSVRFTRRTATVTISAPLASRARAFSSYDLYLPVPMMRRERQVRPATVNGLSSGATRAGALPPPMKWTISNLSPFLTCTWS